MLQLPPCMTLTWIKAAMWRFGFHAEPSLRIPNDGE